MSLWQPDPSFYPSPQMAMQAPAERYGYVALVNTANGKKPDGLGVVDLDPISRSYGQLTHVMELPYMGDELHHFGWNACSSALCPYAPHPHLERRYLIIPGIASSRVYIADTKPNPRRPQILKVIEPDEFQRSGYANPHTIHCGPDAIYVSTLGSADGNGGPAGIAMLDHFNFDVLGAWELDRGSQELGYDFWWHLTHDVMVTSEWGKPYQFANGFQLEEAVNGCYGHRLHFWDLRKRKNVQTVDLGKEHQMVLELRPAHNPIKTYGFVSVVLNTTDLSSSIWTWFQEEGKWQVKKIIDIPAQPADEADLPPALKQFKAVPPLVTDINLSLDDKFLYVSCWGTGELLQYDVSNPFQPQLTGKVEIGGIARKKGHPKAKGPLLGGPQMVEISRDGKRVYFTNSLYTVWDDQFYPDKMGGWMAKLDVKPNGGIEFDPNFFVDFGEARAHQVRLEGGDASTDSFCYPG